MANALNTLAALTLTLLGGSGGAPAHAGDREIAVEPPRDGRIAAFVLAGPYVAGKAARGHLALGDRPGGMPAQAPTRAGEPACPGCSTPSTLSTVSTLALANGALDLRETLRPPGEALAYASFGVRALRAQRALLLLGADDGVRVSLDGRPVYTRDESRPPREDDDAVPLELSAGDHAITLELHQRDGAWQLRARLVNEALARPADLLLLYPGSASLGAGGVRPQVRLLRTLDPSGRALTPALSVGFPDGLTEAADRRVRARLVRGAEVLFEVDAGSAARLGETRIALPAVPLSELTSPAKLVAEVSGIKTEFAVGPAPTVTQAIASAEAALASRPTAELDDARNTVRLLALRLRGFVESGDTDIPAQELEARELVALAAELGAGRDGTRLKRGASRRGIVTRADGQLSELGLYVPPSYRPEGTRKHGLVVALHGLNGKPMQMLRWFFGKDDPNHDGAWEDRHMPSLPPTDVFVLAPTGHGNGMYRELGEEAVMDALRWTLARYRIDPSRVSITGPSMGGIGAAAIPLRHPWTFSAAAPLCGYHGTFVRRDVIGKRLRPWERFLGEERSNADWAPNGRGLPLYVVHGTQDLPEEHSGVLIDRYKALGFSVKHEHPALGHNVWQPTYEKPETLRWLLGMRADLHPKSLIFRTARSRWGESAWVHVLTLERPDAWGEVRARAEARTRIEATTKHVTEIAFARDEVLFEAGSAIEAHLDGATLTFAPGQPLVAHKADGTWAPGPSPPSPTRGKSGTVTGPFRDVFHEPLLFVYGASDPREATANERVARAFAAVRPGVTVSYPVLSDSAFLEKNEPLANDRALFLVGSARSNRVLAALERIRPFPITLDSKHQIHAGANTYEGTELGAAFVYPNPARADRYVAVVFGATPEGTLRALSLPDLLPDFAIYDARVAQARGQLVLGDGSLRAAGFFGSDWSLPGTLADPFGPAPSTARSEHDATPFLP